MPLASYPMILQVKVAIHLAVARCRNIDPLADDKGSVAGAYFAPRKFLESKDRTLAQWVRLPPTLARSSYASSEQKFFAGLLR